MPPLMTTETLHIRNFAGLDDVRIELKPVTVLIGPQASGKSVCAKLAFFFKEIIRRLPAQIQEENHRAGLRIENHRLFLSYFPSESWSAGVFEITYEAGELRITARRKTAESDGVELEYSDFYDRLIDLGRAEFHRAEGSNGEARPQNYTLASEAVVRAVEEHLTAGASQSLTNISYFIPAGRSFFATFRKSLFALLSVAQGIDPFLVEFGKLYEIVRRLALPEAEEPNASSITARIEELLGGKYFRDQGDDFIRMPDGRRVPLTVSSSGQQELLPLVITLATIGEDHERARSTLFVEEPEAHLFPTAQRQIVHLFAAVTDLLSPESSSQYIITTHSPYILAALNNLMYGGKITREHPEQREAVLRLLGPDVLIDPEKVGAYSLENGGAQSIIDPETQLVEATLIDRVSGDLAREFEQLVAIEFEGAPA